MARHPLGRLDGYLEGTLSGHRRRRVASHLQSCPYCTDAVRERARVLAAARRVERDHAHGVTPASHGVTPAGHGSTAAGATHRQSVAMAAQGVSGRFVVAGLGVLVLAAGALAAVWVAGDPSDAASSPDLADARSIVADAESEADPAASAESAGAASAAVAAENGAAIRALRRQGWAVPSLQTVGLRPQGLEVASDQDVVEVSVDWSDEERTVHVRECRSAGEPAVPAACPGQDGAPAATEGTLPVGVTYHVTADDGTDTWTAVLPVGQARYVVTSDMPRERVEQLLSMMVLSERSSVADDLGDPDEITDRLERGIDRLLGSVGLSTGVARGPAL
ncbi:zf-HC2 domain-containing protein [Micrococcus lylae]|uniref:Zf-HC2 domain-containing protein n=1 Tax=Micrococcus lylae TaxID=1273 RepID=A0ABY2K163_9MICC|nr:zf-HC2 domain-containing protein [Micrococcus sp. HMSC067E09]OFR87545.1 hypothetical protein HMPREF2863_02730 [Micrococcus sp. HMSC067E09]TFI00380.1 zf-HC2 domain-containing protein [Micrococcus lylae]